MKLNWTKPAGDVDGYEVWIKYGINDATADWDKIALLSGDA